MNKGLDLKIVRNIGTDFLDLSQRKLSRRHHALCPLLIPEPVGTVIGVVCLRTDMALDLGTDFLSNHIDPRIGNDQRIRLYLPKLGKILSHTVEISVVRQDIGGNVYFHIMGMRKSNPLPDLFHGKVLRFRAESERFAPDIYCIRSVDHSNF